MSSRQLRKLQQQRELEKQAQLLEKPEEESDDEPLPPKPKASLFAGYAALEDEDNGDEEEEEASAEEKVNDHEPVATPAPKKSKKSKKKKKAKNKAQSTEQDEHGVREDEIEAALRELNLKPDAKNSSTEPAPKLDDSYERVCELLGINSQHLKVANEMRTLFGKSAIENHDDAGGPVPRSARGRRQRAQQRQMDLETVLKGTHAPGKGLSELTLRRNPFIQGKDDWPKASTGGLSMEVVDDKTEDGTVEFRFVHDSAYQRLQTNFHGLVEIGEPQNLIGLLQQNPYHISLLIQVSKIAKNQTDHALSSDLLERALFTFGRASMSLFHTKLQQGKARLDFARPENRELWLAGYHYIKSLVMKGTYRTALEWAKTLLSLDPEGDPYSMRLMIHHLGLRAHQHEWLLSFGESDLPVIWHRSNVAIRSYNHLLPSFAYAALLLRKSVKCRDLLTDAMKTVPWLFTRLFSELNLDAPPSIWGITPRTKAETMFSELYVLQTKDLWGTPEATALLMEVAHTIPKGSIDLWKILETKDDDMTIDVVRFVYLDNNPTIMQMVPSHLLHINNNSDSDPIPPIHNTFSYPFQQHVLEPQGAGGMGGLGFGADFMNPFAAMGGLMPGLPGFRFAPRGADDDEFDDDDEEGEEEDAVRAGLEAAIENGEEGASRVGLVGRVFDMLFGRGGDDDDDEEEGTDTDSMPGLIGESDDEVEEDGDADVDMPGLVGESDDEDMPELINERDGSR